MEHGWEPCPGRILGCLILPPAGGVLFAAAQIGLQRGGETAGGVGLQLEHLADNLKDFLVVEAGSATFADHLVQAGKHSAPASGASATRGRWISKVVP